MSGIRMKLMSALVVTTMAFGATAAMAQAGGGAGGAGTGAGAGAGAGGGGGGPSGGAGMSAGGGTDAAPTAPGTGPGAGGTGAKHSTAPHAKMRSHSSMHGAKSKAGDAVNGNTNGMSPMAPSGGGNGSQSQ
ncbi:hypothetical protein [Burkholderia glumae]|nr:hypothetical protein [Burkholderia glumae]MCQ0030160.1 hypothetical protein [Burkholderia glumae]MCQ0035630.1 hypothetical protein [Burkholderia glumae]